MNRKKIIAATATFDFEDCRKQFFNAVKNGHFKEANRLLGTVPSENIISFMSSQGNPSGKNVLSWLCQCVKNMNQKAKKSFEDSLNSPNSEIMKLLKQLVPVAKTLLVQNELNTNKTCIDQMLDVLGKQLSTQITKAMGIALGDRVDGGYNITNPFRHYVLWNAFLNKTLSLPNQHPGILIIGSGLFEPKTYKFEIFGNDVKEIVFEKPFSPQLHEVKKFLSPRRIEVVDASLEVIEAVATEPRDIPDYFPTTLCYPKKTQTTTHATQLSLEWSVESFQNLPAIQGGFDLILATHILLYPFANVNLPNFEAASDFFINTAHILFSLASRLMNNGKLIIDMHSLSFIAGAENKQPKNVFERLNKILENNVNSTFDIGYQLLNCGSEQYAILTRIQGS